MSAFIDTILEEARRREWMDTYLDDLRLILTDFVLAGDTEVPDHDLLRKLDYMVTDLITAGEFEDAGLIHEAIQRIKRETV